MKKLKTQNGDAQKKRSSREVRGVSPEVGRESMGGRDVWKRYRISGIYLPGGQLYRQTNFRRSNVVDDITV